MSRKYIRLRRILGVSTIILAILIASLPTTSFAMDEQNITVENRSSYQDGTITATVRYSEYDDRNVSKLIIEEMDEQNITVENRSSYQDGTITATVRYSEYDDRNVSKLIIEDYPVMDNYVYDSGFYSRQYDNFMAIKVRAVDESGNDVSAAGNITIPMPSSWDTDSFFLFAGNPDNDFFSTR